MRYLLIALPWFLAGHALAADCRTPEQLARPECAQERAGLAAIARAQKPIDCFAPDLPARQGIECLQRMRERRNFEETLKALQR
jgi:hypothetical protein